MSDLLKDKHVTLQRWNLLLRFSDFLRPLMNFLAFAWLVLTIYEFTHDLSEGLEKVILGIWIIFWIDFLVELSLAPNKKVYLRHNIITVLSLLLPALRVLRIARVIRVAATFRGSALVKILSSTNRGMKALKTGFAGKGLVYIVSLSFIVILISAAGIINFESETGYFHSYGDGLWWASMMVTTMGSDYFPKTIEGRILGFMLAVYGFAIFGYVTASVAHFFIGQKDSRSKNDIELLRKEISELKNLLIKNKQ